MSSRTDMNIEEPASIKPRSKLSIAVEKAAAQLEASKKEKQRETAAADASSAILASVLSEVADQPADDATPSSNNNKDIEAAAVPIHILVSLRRRECQSMTHTTTNPYHSTL